MRKTAARAVFLIIVLAALIGAGYYVIFRPIDNPEDRVVIIPRGAGIARIAQILHDAGAISHPGFFALAAKLTGTEKSLKAGKYLLPKYGSHLDILRLLEAGKPFQDRIVIPEGVTARRIASILAEKVEIDSSRFMAVVNDSAFATSLGVPAPSLEGFLFPETYRMSWGMSPQEAARMMVAEFFQQLPDSAAALAAGLGMTLREAIALASIIEGEAIIDSERVKISAVYHNRLRKGMRLQADPTIQYIIPDGPRRLLRDDLLIESSYNTYRYAGLPPGPINNPGRKSIYAALYPARVPYLYFVARGDGSHAFSVTWNQHLQAKKKFDKVRRTVARERRLQKEGKL